MKMFRSDIMRKLADCSTKHIDKQGITKKNQMFLTSVRLFVKPYSKNCARNVREGPFAR